MKPIITKCPTCGCENIRRITATLREKDRDGVEFEIPAVEHESCPDCGEQLFDSYAMRRIEHYRRQHALGVVPPPPFLPSIMLTCPMCGGRRVRRVARDFRRKTPEGVPFVVRKLKIEECPDCGETFFDPPAMRRIQEARKKAALAAVRKPAKAAAKPAAPTAPMLKARSALAKKPATRRAAR